MAKTVNWSNVYADDIVAFVDRRVSLNYLRVYGHTPRSEIYKMERMGVNRARAAARKAIQRGTVGL